MTEVVLVDSDPSGRPSGLAVGDLAWGTHVCHFYDTAQDLIEVLVPYFAAGLQANERCIWITAEPLSSAEAREALARSVPDLDDRLRAGQIEILDHLEWYQRIGAHGLDQVVQGWTEREERARSEGYEGLRIAGNLSWLSPADWRGFTEYEATVHEAFQSRRILAVCSYWLQRLGSDEILDVVENHGCSLARFNGSWQALGSASILMAARQSHGAAGEAAFDRGVPLDRPGGGCPHLVRFFHEDAYPAERIADHVERGISSGAGAWILATAVHVEAITAALSARGIDVASAVEAGTLVVSDAEKIARSIMQRGDAGQDAFTEVYGPLLERPRSQDPLLVYGEVVDVLVRGGHAPRALEVERWWDEAIAAKRLSVLCGYALDSFPDAESVANFRRVCAAHALVEPAEGSGAVGSGRLAAELQQSMAALASEARQRRQSEDQRERLREAERAARMRAEAATEQLVRLQRVMSALSEVSRPSEVANVVAGEMAAAVQADKARLVVADDDEQQESAAPADPPELTGRSSVPLVLRGKRLGAVELSFADGAERSAMQRALVADCSRQVAFALDRALSYEAAEQSSRAKDEFLAMLGHELRNPLAPIVTALDVMKLTGDPEPSKELQVIERHVEHMIGLIDDLMDIARITRGVLSLRKQPLEIAAVVSRAVEMVTPLLEAKQHHLSLSVPHTGLRVHGDEGRLTQVLSNLLTNAARYSPPGCELSLSTERDGGQVVVRVKDRGNGIDPELLPHIFDPFRQGQRDSDRAKGGLGLGLALVQSLVQLHGGTVTALSEGPGRGSEFVVRLPALEAVRPRQVARPSGSAAATSRSPSRVLLVDDNEDAAEMLAMVLRRSGHEVAVAHDGPQALRCAPEFRPDFAVLDIGLPVMDGYELAERLRAELGTDLHLLALTGYGQKGDMARSREAGFARHFVKPVQAKRLLQAIDELCPEAPASTGE